MPDRLIRESALTSESLGALSDFAERLFWRLTTVADDYGRFNANASVIAGRCMPLVGGVTVKRIEAALVELQETGTVRLYEIDGRRFGYFPQWNRYQQTRAKKSKFPEPPTSADICLQTPTDANNCFRAGTAPNTNTNTNSNTDQGESEGETNETDTPVTPDELMEGWNTVASDLGLATIRELSETRLKHIRPRLKEHPAADWWKLVLGNIRGSPFLQGQVTDFKVSFDWLIENDNNALKIYEGKYAPEAIKRDQRQRRNGHQDANLFSMQQKSG